MNVPRLAHAGVLSLLLLLAHSESLGQCGDVDAVGAVPDGSAVPGTQLAAGRNITTIEGLATDAGKALQEAWVEEQVPQCGYCQSGQIMTAAELVARGGTLDEETVVTHMSGNICRCGAYNAIKRAVMRAGEIAEGDAATQQQDMQEGADR